ncbi:MAG: DUF1826 domain-containing protein, partial [Pseudomonadota bacterium]
SMSERSNDGCAARKPSPNRGRNVSLAQTVDTPLAKTIGMVDSLDGLAAIHGPGHDAVVWTRSPLQSFQNWLDALHPACLPRASLVLPPLSVRDAVGQCCALAGTPDNPHRDLLVDDIAALAWVFAEIASASYIQLRLDVLSASPRRMRDPDTDGLRLVCTYRGRGTQCGIADRGAQARRVFTVPTGAPIVSRRPLRANDAPSALHQHAPPDASTHDTRLLLTLEPVEPTNAGQNPVFH